MMNRDSRIFVSGHRGVVGSAITTHFKDLGFKNILVRNRGELDLRDFEAVQDFLLSTRPELCVAAAAKVGGIAANMTAPVGFLIENLEIQNSLLLAVRDADVGKTIFLGSSCIYPREAPQPMKEEYFMHGPVEPTNDSYAIAKIAGIQLARALRRESGTRIICPLPCNVYGPRDHFEFERSHVISALVRRFVDATENGDQEITLWGTGTARREFIHSRDLARACVFLADHYDDEEIINVGTGLDYSIREIAELIASQVGFDGRIEWDTNRPDGMPRKLLDIGRITDLGWQPEISLEAGIVDVIADYRFRTHQGTIAP